MRCDTKCSEANELFTIFFFFFFTGHLFGCEGPQLHIVYSVIRA